MPPRRELAAIVFTDIVGSTQLAQDDEAAAIRLSVEHTSLARPALRARGGRVIKTMGDGLLAKFPNALDAVEFGVELQRRLRARNVKGSTPQLRVRVGIHLGDVEVRGSDIFGDSVNIASRIERSADPGGINVSGAIYQQVRRKLPYSWQDLGSKRLPGLRESLDLYRVVPPWEWAPPATDRPSADRLAVLPLTNLSPDPQDAFFADGLTEELIGAIAARSEFRVIARTSTMRYKGSPLAIRDIARELGVERVLEGSVRRSGRKLRVTVQLIDARTEEPQWALQFDREVDDVFAIQSEIAGRVAGSVRGGTRSGRLSSARPEPEAYTTYLRAIQLFHTDTAESLRESIALFERAARKDPSLALAHVGTVRAWTNLALQRAEEWSVIETHALPAAREALRADPDLPEAHAAISGVLSSLDHHLEAIREAEQAIRLKPGCSAAYLPLGGSLAAVGRLKECYEALVKGHELDPLDPVTACGLAEVAQALGHLDEMHRVVAQLLELHGGNVNVVRSVALTLDAAGEAVEARDLITVALRREPGNRTLESGQAILAATGADRRGAERLLARLKGSYTTDGYMATQLQARAALGDIDPAFDALDVLAERHSWPWLIKTAPVYSRMRRDPRFKDFCERVGIAFGTGASRSR